MGKTSEVVGKDVNPSGDVRATNHVEILEGMAADRFNDNVSSFELDYVRKGSNKTRLGGRMVTNGAMKTRAQIVTGGVDWII